MKTFKTILFVALIIFHVATVVIISIGKNDLNFLFDLFKQMDLIQYVSIAALVLFLGVIFVFQQQEKNKAKLIEKHENEINQFKAKLYDKKESDTTGSTAVSKDSKPDSTEKPNSDSNNASNSTKTEDTDPKA